MNIPSPKEAYELKQQMVYQWSKNSFSELDDYLTPCERPEHLKVTDFLANEIKIRKDKLVALNEEIKHLQASVDAIRNSMS